MKAKSKETKLNLLATDKYQPSGKYFKRACNSECEILKLLKSMSKPSGEKKEQSNYFFQTENEMCVIVSAESTRQRIIIRTLQRERKSKIYRKKMKSVDYIQQYLFDFQQKNLSYVLGKDTNT